jgi:hypothetical protein
MIKVLGKNPTEFRLRDSVNSILKRFERVQKKRIIEVSSAYTITLEDHTILVDATSGAVTITLPKAYNGFEYLFNVKKIDSSANTVTIDGDGSEKIDGATTKVISTQYDSITIQSDKTEWWII